MRIKEITTQKNLESNKYRTLFEYLGIICFLEGGSDAFDGYNEVNNDLKDIYDYYGWEYIVVENLYSMTSSEVVSTFKNILTTCKSIATKTTNTRYQQIKELRQIAKQVKASIKNKKDIKLKIFLEQSDYLDSIASDLDCIYHGNIFLPEELLKFSNI